MEIICISATQKLFEMYQSATSWHLIPPGPESIVNGRSNKDVCLEN